MRNEEPWWAAPTGAAIGRTVFKPASDLARIVVDTRLIANQFLTVCARGLYEGDMVNFVSTSACAELQNLNSKLNAVFRNVADGK